MTKNNSAMGKQRYESVSHCEQTKLGKKLSLKRDSPQAPGMQECVEQVPQKLGHNPEKKMVRIGTLNKKGRIDPKKEMVQIRRVCIITVFQPPFRLNSVDFEKLNFSSKKKPIKK